MTRFKYICLILSTSYLVKQVNLSIYNNINISITILKMYI